MDLLRGPVHSYELVLVRLDFLGIKLPGSYAFCGPESMCITESPWLAITAQYLKLNYEMVT